MNSIPQNGPSSSSPADRGFGSRPRHAFLAAILMLLCATLVSGCRSMTMPASASFASVVIPGHSVLHIEEAAFAVFKADGYRASLAGGGKMTFEREGSRQSELAYSGFSGEAVAVRVRAEIVDLGNGSHRLQCQAYMVQDAGDGFFEEEIRLTNLRRMPFQRLLDAVAKKLK